MIQTGNIHGHEILELVHAASAPFTRDSLRAEAARRFGAEAKFCTCSASDMSFDQLLVFLFSREKVVETGGFIRPGISQMCSHDGGHDHHHD